MASNAGDAFDVDSALFLSDDDEGYEDLMRNQYATDAPELLMTDSEEEYMLAPPTSNAAAPGPKRVLDDSGNTATGWQTEREIAVASGTDSDQIRSLLAGDTKDSAASSDPCVDTDVPLKEETPDLEIMWERFMPAEVIDISDTEEGTSTNNAKTSYKYGTSMADGTIEISDGEVEREEIILYEDGSTSVAIKKENADVEFLGAKKHPVEAPEDSSSEDEPHIRQAPKLGKCLLKRPIQRVVRTPADIEKAKRMQKIYADKALAMGVKVGASGIFKAPQPLELSVSGNASDNNFSWMRDTVLPAQPMIDFHALKLSYKAKRKSRTNTLEDDVNFKKAQIEENNRLKRLALEIADSGCSEDEAEESDNGLFMPKGRPHSFARSRSLTPEDEDDNNDTALAEMLTGKPAPKKLGNDIPRSKAELSTKRSRARDREREERSNMMAGIEAILLRDQKRQDEAAAKEAQAEEAANGVKRSNKRKKTKPVDNSAKRTKTGRMNNIASLVTSNIYEDSNANLDKPALPHVTDKKKKDFMTSLVANVPLADKKQANSDRIDIVRATKILGNYMVSPDGEGNWAFKGMKSALYHHQVQGAAYMKSREIGDQAPYGGILADEMGLGKTVQTIATMCANPQLDENLPKCTLIVCSPALMGQWENELETHAKENKFEYVSRHHSTKRFSGKNANKSMERHDVVLTTYGEVIKSYPNCDFPKELRISAEKEAWWERYWDENRDLLHRAHFYRVVLDEAQVIKNHTSQTSIACRALMAKHRWAISGTPIQNRLDELFPYFKFLRVKHTGSMAVFRQNFCLKDSDTCNKRLHSMLDGMMVRRTHQDTVLGAPLLKLPQNTQATIRLKFNKVERHIYELIRMRCVKTINAVANDTLEEKKKAVIIMFQRLRQMVSHIFMVQEVIEKEVEMFNIDAMWEHIITENDRHTSSEKSMMLGLKKMIAEKEDRSEESQSIGMLFTNANVRPDASRSKKKADNLTGRFKKLLKDLRRLSKWPELRERSLCHTCGNPPEDAHVTSCLHVYCEACLSNLAYDASNRGFDQTPCGACGTIFSESVACGELKELQLRDLSASVFQDSKNKLPLKKPFKLTMDYIDSEDGLLLSSKCAAVKEQLQKWITEDPSSKIIVFTEWMMVMHVIGRVCQQMGWKCCHYNGSMSHKARDEGLSAFRDSGSDVQVLVASLKCGGTGLNLTVASKVICVDLWFNSCVEQQAFARVFRIGQKQETYITRCVVEDTVDERLIEMQEEKKEIISAAMDDRSIMAQLTLPELLRLFGPVAYKDGKPFILVDDDEKRPKSSK